MYNPYLSPPDLPEAPAPSSTPPAPREEGRKGLAALLKNLRLDGLDTGDALLLLILLLLFLDNREDNLELLITLGLTLLL